MSENSEKSANSSWNYHPDLPLANPSIFQWPTNPTFLFKWIFNNWLTLSERILLVALSILLWKFCYPDFNKVQILSFDWVAQTYVVNFLLILTFAGLLHWYFYMRKRCFISP